MSSTTLARFSTAHDSQSSSVYAIFPIGQSPVPAAGRRVFDCSICDDLPALEIEADSEEEAKAIYLAAVIKTLTLDKIEAIELPHA